MGMSFIQHPTIGDTRVLGVPVILNETPGNPRGRAPELGEHTGSYPYRLARLYLGRCCEITESRSDLVNDLGPEPRLIGPRPIAKDSLAGEP